VIERAAGRSVVEQEIERRHTAVNPNMKSMRG
jgi:hypothetical protein